MHTYGACMYMYMLRTMYVRIIDVAKGRELSSRVESSVGWEGKSIHGSLLSQRLEHSFPSWIQLD